MTNKKRVLSDHRQIGKKFIPPIIDILGSVFQPTSWIKEGIPEMIWIALLNQRYGHQTGADLSSSLAKAAKEATGKNIWYGKISNYSMLSDAEKAKVISILEASNKISSIRSGLFALNACYPKSPLFFINGKEIDEKDKTQSVQEIKEVARSLYDKTTKETVFTQANGVYIAFVTDKLNVTRDSTLANFPEIERYPDSDESRRIAAAIRASISGFVGVFPDEEGCSSKEWQDYFWNRGLEIDKCEANI